MQMRKVAPVVSVRIQTSSFRTSLLLLTENLDKMTINVLGFFSDVFLLK